jgi:hypothetical protein
MATPRRRHRKASLLAFAAASALALAALGGVAAASHDAFRHLSAGEVNGNGAFNATFENTSADGSRVLFETQEQLVGADTDGRVDIYERSGGATKLVSAGQVNGNGPFSVSFAAASADGSRVFFRTDEKLVVGDTDAVQDIYQRSGGTTTQVSAGQVNGNGAFNATFQGASDDGSRVFFETSEQLVGADTDSAQDVYQRSGGATKRISAGAINSNGAFAAGFVGASTDGSRVFFASDEQLVSADTDSAIDVYQRSAATTTLVSAGAINGNGASGAIFVGASADGARAFFVTNEQLVGADLDGQQDIYERSGGTTTRISSGNGAFSANFQGASADGSRVFLTTIEGLVGGDTDGVQDVYERSGGQTKRVSAGQINGNGAFSASFRGASADGSRVFFTTGEQLVSADTDSSTDIYERSGGTTKRVSTGQVNGNGAFNATFRGASDDGSRVFFETSEQLVGADTDGIQDVYERSAGTTTKVSLGNGLINAVFTGASADASAVFFLTSEKVFASDEDDSQDIYGAYIAP